MIVLSVVPESKFLISEEEGFFYKNNPNRDFESLATFESIGFHKKLIEIEVKRAKNNSEAKNVALSIANSLLVDSYISSVGQISSTVIF